MMPNGLRMEGDGKTNCTLNGFKEDFRLETDTMARVVLAQFKSLPRPFTDLDISLSRDMERISVSDRDRSAAALTCSRRDPVARSRDKRKMCSNELKMDRWAAHRKRITHRDLTDKCTLLVNEAPSGGDDRYCTGSNRKNRNTNCHVPAATTLVTPTEGADRYTEVTAAEDDSSRDSGISGMDGESPNRTLDLRPLSTASSEITVKALSFSDESDSGDGLVMEPSPVPKRNKGLFKGKAAFRSVLSKTDAGVLTSASNAFVVKRNNEGHWMTQPWKKRIQDGDDGVTERAGDADCRQAVDIMSMLEGEPDDLIGDLSRAYRLPCTRGSHADLRCISPDTLAALLTGGTELEVHRCRIVDCRYPFEYGGGHVIGAVNVWNRDLLGETFLLDPDAPSHSRARDIVVFHCEFSSERAPKMCRILRCLDRKANSDAYPELHYPEIYLLDGGYKAFYSSYPEMCQPRSYVSMTHPDHVNDLKYFRAISRSMAGKRSSRVRSRRHLLA